MPDHNFHARYDLMKVMIRMNPGILLGLERQIGKTTCLLEMIHDDYQGEAILFSMNQKMAEWTKDRHTQLFNRDRPPYIVWLPEQLRGIPKFPIFVDDWFQHDRETQLVIMRMGNVIVRIGTE